MRWIRKRDGPSVQTDAGDELKKQLDAGTVMIIDVRQPFQFRERNHPAHQRSVGSARRLSEKISKDTYIVFNVRDRSIKLAGCEASRRPRIYEHDILSVSKWKEQGYQAEPGKKK